MKKDIWNNKSKNEKVLFFIRIIASIGVIILAMLQLLGIWNKAINVAAPLMGIVLLVQSIQEWKYSRKVAILGLLCSIFIFICTIVVLFSYNYRDRRTYELNLPEIEEIKRIELKRKADGIALFGIEEIEDVRNVLYGVKRITETESIQDSPVNVDDEIKIDFYIDEENCSTVFAYKKNFKYYIEQPYNGIYRISSDEYNAIEKYIRNATQNFNRSPENVIIEVLQETITKESAEILITDNNQDYYGWGANFRVQKKVDDKWEELTTTDELSFIELAYEVGEDNKLKLKVDYGKYYGILENGIYRIVKPIYDKEYIDLYSNEFEIK